MDANLSYINTDDPRVDTAGPTREKKETKLVEVSWLDSYTESGWAKHEPKKVLSKTYGLLIEKNTDWVSLAMTKEEGYWGNLWYIPTESVENIRVIEVLEI
jgi:hypothetical protein